jgi:hypothetical protein
MIPTTVVVDYQGSVFVQDAYVEARGEDVVAIFVNTETKRPFGGGSTGAGIFLWTSEDDKLTIIRFPEFDGWDAHCSEGSRYGVAVCLVRRKEPAP